MNELNINLIVFGLIRLAILDQNVKEKFFWGLFICNYF